jgi:hypothetical protein
MDASAIDPDKIRNMTIEQMLGVDHILIHTPANFGRMTAEQRAAARDLASRVVSLMQVQLDRLDALEGTNSATRETTHYTEVEYHTSMLGEGPHMGGFLRASPSRVLRIENIDPEASERAKRDLDRLTELHKAWEAERSKPVRASGFVGLGTKVRTPETLSPDFSKWAFARDFAGRQAFGVSPELLHARQASKTGTVFDIHFAGPQDDEDICFVRHDDGSQAAYARSELTTW